MCSSKVQNLSTWMSIWAVLVIPLKTSNTPSGKTWEALFSVTRVLPYNWVVQHLPDWIVCIFVAHRMLTRRKRICLKESLSRLERTNYNIFLVIKNICLIWTGRIIWNLLIKLQVLIYIIQRLRHFICVHLLHQTHLVLNSRFHILRCIWQHEPPSQMGTLRDRRNCRLDARQDLARTTFGGFAWNTVECCSWL